MNKAMIAGLSWILVAGVTQGSFTLPMKFARRWKWEQIWFVYSALAFFLLPWAIALATVPRLADVYRQSPADVILLTALFGAGWGVGSVCFGLGVDALGMALGFSMMTGIYTALGALVPLAVLTPDLVWTKNGAYIVAGNAVMIVGVVISAVAGSWRDRETGVPAGSGLNPGTSFAAGLAICVASGVLSAMLNFAYAFGKPIAQAAERLGASAGNSLNALWLVALPAGGLLNIGYCAHLMRKRRTWVVLYSKTVPLDWVNAWIMAVLWTGSVILYGWGADALGRLGPSLGWSLWNAVLIVATVICGLLTDEWRGANRRSIRMLIVGIAVLILSTALLGLGGAGA